MDVRKMVLDYLDKQAAFKAAEADFNKYKKWFYGGVRQYLQKKGKTSFTFQDDSRGSFSVSDIRPKKVKFDPVKMRKVLSVEICDEVIKTESVLEDKEGFWKYMEKLGADEAMVLSFFRTTESVYEKALDNMVGSGKLSMDNLEGCYEVSVSEGYIMVTEMEK